MSLADTINDTKIRTPILIHTKIDGSKTGVLHLIARTGTVETKGRATFLCGDFVGFEYNFTEHSVESSKLRRPLGSYLFTPSEHKPVIVGQEVAVGMYDIKAYMAEQKFPRSPNLYRAYKNLRASIKDLNI